jgi:1-acyl-sn-glycerol-3-phosphate acyltransferase
MQSLRAAAILTAFLLLTLPLMPLQYALVRLNSPWARRLPHWYHRQVCRLVGVRIDLQGRIAEDRPTLIVANHVSWLDIPVLSAIAPVSFIAKREVGTWPFVGSLARLQRSVFVDRERRNSVAEVASGIVGRLRQGDHIVLFAEGTSSDGNRVLPFKTSLFGAARPNGPDAAALESGIYVQTLAIAYTRQQGLPFGRRNRPYIAWYGAMHMPPHAWALLRRGPIDVSIRVSPPLALSDFADRKALARATEARVRADMAELLSPRRPRPEPASNAAAASPPAATVDGAAARS